LELRPLALDGFADVVACAGNARTFERDLFFALMVLGLGGGADVGPGVLVVNELVVPGVGEHARIGTNARVERFGSGAHGFSSCDAVLVLAMNRGMRGVGAVA